MTLFKTISLLLLVVFAATLSLSTHNEAQFPDHEDQDQGSLFGISKEHHSHSNVPEIKKLSSRLIDLLEHSQTLANQLLVLDSRALSHETEMVSFLHPLNKIATSSVLQGKDPREDQQFQGLSQNFTQASAQAANFRKLGAETFEEIKKLNQEAIQIETDIRRLVSQVLQDVSSNQGQQDTNNSQSQSEPEKPKKSDAKAGPRIPDLLGKLSQKKPAAKKEPKKSR